MNENKFLKIFTILGFLAFAAVSCWATAESLHLLLPSIPLILCWVVTIGFFFIASWGTKMIVDSFNQEIYLEKRGLHLLGGIVLTIIFWLLCSMPTNTHTFFFRSVIDNKVSQDITMTKNYLNQIKTNVVTETKIQLKCAELRKQVELALGELEAEIKNEAVPGLGPKAKAVLDKLANILGVVKIETLAWKGNSVQELEKLCRAYRSKVLLLLDNRLMILIKEMTPPSKDYMKLAENDYKNLELVEKYIKDKTLDLTNAEDVNTVCEHLNKGYATIKSYSQFVDFKNETDKEQYTANNPVTKVKRMISVFDVWSDFLKGEYAGHGFFFWVMISVLVDIAAFIFFDIAFKRRN
jgi:hypothetical protein